MSFNKTLTMMSTYKYFNYELRHKVVWAVKVQLLEFFVSEIDSNEMSASFLGRFYPEKDAR